MISLVDLWGTPTLIDPADVTEVTPLPGGFEALGIAGCRVAAAGPVVLVYARGSVEEIKSTISVALTDDETDAIEGGAAPTGANVFITSSALTTGLAATQAGSVVARFEVASTGVLQKKALVTGLAYVSCVKNSDGDYTITIGAGLNINNIQARASRLNDVAGMIACEMNSATVLRVWTYSELGADEDSGFVAEIISGLA